MAFQRRWAFMSLMKKLIKVPLRIYPLTQIFGDNCKMSGFDGKDTAHALWNGAVQILDIVTLVGFDEEQAEYLCRVTRSVGIKLVKVDNLGEID